MFEKSGVPVEDHPLKTKKVVAPLKTTPPEKSGVSIEPVEDQKKVVSPYD